MAVVRITAENAEEQFQLQLNGPNAITEFDKWLTVQLSIQSKLDQLDKLDLDRQTHRSNALKQIAQNNAEAAAIGQPGYMEKATERITDAMVKGMTTTVETEAKFMPLTHLFRTMAAYRQSSLATL